MQPPPEVPEHGIGDVAVAVDVSVVVAVTSSSMVVVASI